MIYAYIIGGIIFLSGFIGLAILMRKEYREIKEPCPEFPFFGAPYNDATCINGELWDLDSCNDEGLLTKMADEPCPFCRSEEYKEFLIDNGCDEYQAVKYVKFLHNKYKK